MNHILENRSIYFLLEPSQGGWDLTSLNPKGPYLKNVQMRVVYRVGRARHQFDLGSLSFQPGRSETIDSPLGPLHVFHSMYGPDPKGLLYPVDFAVPENHPLFLWRLKVENASNRPVSIERLELLNAGFIYASPPGTISSLKSPVKPGVKASSEIHPAQQPGELAFYSNGWQSWSYSGAYGQDDRFWRTRLGPLSTPMRVNQGTPQPRRTGLYGSDMFGALVDLTHRTGIISGFLSQEQHFGSLEALSDPARPALRMWANGDGARLDPGETVTSDWACLTFFHLDNPHPLDAYLNAVALQNGFQAKPEKEPLEGVPTGWCSWYQFYQGVTEADIRRNLKAAVQHENELPLQLILIDDGFEAQVGDWLSFSDSFPGGVAPLAAEIRDAGFQPGLWLAPFIVQSRSQLARKHPDWLLRNRYGRPVNAGFVWNSFGRALDLTHPEALDYVCQVVRTAVHDWGYGFLKLDFLYAASLPGRYRDPKATRAKVLRSGLRAIRDAAGQETTLLGCGCPLGPAIGLVDQMRIGADVAPRWNPAYNDHEFFFKGEPDMPSARNAIHNALTRAPLHGRWWINDPDCLVVRPTSLLNLNEVQTLATVIALTGGSLLLSDDLSELPSDRLQIVQALLPLIHKRPHVLDLFDARTPAHLQIELSGPAGNWSVIGLFNWDDRPADLKFAINDFYLVSRSGFWVHSFWDQKTDRMEAGRHSMVFENVPAHGCKLLAVKPINPGRPQYLGSDLHVSQGLEITGYNWKDEPGRQEPASGCLHLELSRPGKTKGSLALVLPRPLIRAACNGAPVKGLQPADGVYRVPVEFENAASIDIYC